MIPPTVVVSGDLPIHGYNVAADADADRVRRAGDSDQAVRIREPR